MIDIFTMPIFERKLKHYAKKNSDMKEDYKSLLDTLEKNPTNATPIKEEINLGISTVQWEQCSQLR